MPKRHLCLPHHEQHILQLALEKTLNTEISYLCRLGIQALLTAEPARITEALAYVDEIKTGRPPYGSQASPSQRLCITYPEREQPLVEKAGDRILALCGYPTPNISFLYRLGVRLLLALEKHDLEALEEKVSKVRRGKNATSNAF